MVAHVIFAHSVRAQSVATVLAAIHTIGNDTLHCMSRFILPPLFDECGVRFHLIGFGCAYTGLPLGSYSSSAYTA